MTVEPPGSLADGRYELAEPLGEGGQGRVFRGQDRWTGQSVAIKVVAPGDEETVRREYELLRTVFHRSLVRALDLVRHESALYLVEELIEGEGFEPWARWRNPREIARALAPVAHALAHLHARGVLHGDVSPGNILVDSAGRSVLIDLGLARLEGEGGRVAGTPGFVSPEVSRGEARTPAADVYSFGRFIGRTLSGKHNFALDEITPADARDLVARCLMSAPASRPAAMEVARACLAVAGIADELLNEPQLPVPLVGREAELDAWCERYGSGAPAGWIFGAPGAGKSAFLNSLADIFRSRGAKTLIVSGSAEQAEIRLSAFAGHKLLSASPVRHRAAALALALEKLGEAEPCFIAVDDVDDASDCVGALVEIWQRRETLSFALALSSRERSPKAKGIELLPLDAAAVDRLVFLAFGEPRHELATSLYRRIGGNPAELIAELGGAEHSSSVSERWADVPPRLAAVAMLDMPLDPEVLGRFLGAETLEWAQRRGWLVRDGEGGSLRLPRQLRERVSCCQESLSELALFLEDQSAWGESAVAWAETGEIERARAALEASTRAAAGRRAAGDGEQTGWGSSAGRLLLFRRINVASTEVVVEPRALRLWGELAAEAGDLKSAEAAALGLAKAGASVEGRSLIARAAIQIGDYARALSELDGPPRDSVEAASKARALYFVGRAAEALEMAERFVDSAEDRDAVALYDCAGHSALVLGQGDAAVEFLRAALVCAEKLDEPARLARARHSLAIALHRCGSLDEAGELYEKSIVDLEPWTLASRALNYATYLQDRGRFEDAEREYRLARERAIHLGNARERARAGVNLANVLVSLGELAEARDLAETVRRQSRLDDLRLAEIMAGLVSSEAELEAERGEAARAALREVYATLDGFDDRNARDEAGLLDARITAAEGSPQAAFELLDDSLLSPGDFQLRLEFYRAKLAVLLARSDAVERATRAAESCRAGGDELAWRSLAVLADALAQSGADAEEVRREALAVFERFIAGLSSPRRASYRSIADRSALLNRLAASRGSSASRSIVLGASTGGRPLRRLVAINRSLAREADIKTLLERIVDSAIELLGAERGFLLLAGRGGVEVAVARNLDRRAIESGPHRFSKSIAVDVFESGETVLTANALSDARYVAATSIAKARIRSVLCVPLRGMDKNDDPLIGALYLEHRFQDRVFTELDAEIGEAFADQASIALSNAQLFERVRDQEKQLRSQNEALEKLNNELRSDAARAAEQAEAALRRLREEGPQIGVGRGFEKFIGRSPALKQVLRLVERFADTEVPVLITGESGTGKELIARALHDHSDRAGAPFVSVNCGAIPENLFESELFGHAKGAFTGAHRDKPGLLEAARGGTLFLDEVAEMPLLMQVKLLRVVQEGEYRPVGSNSLRMSEARLVSATHRNLEDRVATGLFREDLFYRLNVVAIVSAPLRERRDDIIPLIDHFCAEFSARSADACFSRAALEVLQRYEWPGNIRELQNEVRRTLALADGVANPQDLSEKVRGSLRASTTAVARTAKGSLKEIVEGFERDVLLNALERTGWNVKQTAKELGLSRAALYTRLSRYDIHRSDPSG